MNNSTQIKERVMSNILLIDAKKDNVLSVSALIIKYIPGCVVNTALTSDEGLKKAKQEFPDTILIDMFLPVKDGYEVCQELKSNETTKHIPVIMLTGVKTNSKSCIKALELGADGFLRKPVDAGELTTQVKAMLRIKNAEDQLKENKDSFEKIITDRTEQLQYQATVMENISDAVISTDLKFTIKGWNEAAEEIYGWKKKEVLGKIFREVLHPEYLEDKRENFYDKIKKDKKYRGEFTHYRKDGKPVTIFSSVSVIKDETDKEVGIVSVNRDITERKLIEAEIIEWKNRYESAIQASGHILYDWDSSTNQVTYGGAVEKILGYSMKEMEGGLKRWIELIHPDDVDHFNKTIEYIKTTKNQAKLNYRIKTKGGKYIYIEDSGNFTLDANGNINRMIGFVKDITERRQAENALRESEEFLNSIVENIPNMIFVKDGKDLRFVRFNKAGKELLGYSSEELIGKNDYDFFPKDEADFFTSKDRVVLETGTLIDIPEELIQTRQKGERILHTKKIPLCDHQGVPQYLLGISEDITERKQTEAQLEKSLKEKEILIKEIYHRVKNNLAVVSGLLNIQSTYIKDRQAIAAIHDTRDRIFSMSAVHSQLYHSEDYSTVDFKEYIKNLASNIFYASKMSGRVKFHLDLDDITLPIDKAIPCGLLINEIVTNALKHAFPENQKGNLRIITHSLDEKNCEIIINDDGIGIPKSFDIEKAKSLGLKLIDMMAKQIDGTLEIIIKKGTEFRIRLSTEPGQVIR